MPIQTRDAKKLCTKPEFELFEASLKGKIESLTPARLKQKIQRSRNLRDKWRDESKRQRREKRGKVKARSTRPAQSNENTVKKAELFGEALGRFQKQLETIEARKKKEAAAKKKVIRGGVAEKRSGRPKGVRRAKPRKPKADSEGKVAPERPGVRARKKAAGKKARVKSAGAKRILGHVSSRNKRNQARRDTRSGRA